MKRIVTLLLAASIAAPCSPVFGEPTLTTGGVRLRSPVKSMQEMRFAGVVRQKWDQSCASAALSTVLTHYLDSPADETVIAAEMVRYGDPLRVRQRGGFSLLDLKNYAQRHGYRSRGYGRMSLEELSAFRTPAIVPIRTRGYDHFVIFVALIEDRVVLADPAYGNVTLTYRQFERVWQNGVAFMVFKGAIHPAEQVPEPSALLPVARLSGVARALRGMGPVPATRVGR